MTEAADEGVQNSAFDETDFGAVDTDLEARNPDGPEDIENNEDTEEVWEEDLDDFQVNLLEDYESVEKEDRNFIYLLFKPIIWCARIISNNSKIAEWCFYGAFVIGNCHKYTWTRFSGLSGPGFSGTGFSRANILMIKRLYYFHWIRFETKFWRRSYSIGPWFTFCCPLVLG